MQNKLICKYLILLKTGIQRVLHATKRLLHKQSISTSDVLVFSVLTEPYNEKRCLFHLFCHKRKLFDKFYI